MDELMLRTLMAGIGTALLTGMVGPLVLWRRMAYVGDAMGHSALLAVALGMLIGLAPMPSILLLALVAGLLLARLTRDKRLPPEALLVMLSTGGLAAGMMLFSNNSDYGRGDVMSYLFGDILAVNDSETIWIYGIAALLACWLRLHWKDMLRSLVHEDVAQVEGVNTKRMNHAMLIMVALTVAVAVQVVGILLVTALLVVPALVARGFTRDPARMLFGSVLVGVFASVVGIYMAYSYNQPVGPSIVLTALTLFCASRLQPQNRS